MDLTVRARGLLVGLAVGDALGLPREGLTPALARRLHGDPMRHAFWLGRGVVSDDTEHAAFTGEALVTTRGDPARFSRALAWRLRTWIAALPPGVGWATLRACLLLWLGVSPARSGRRSAGNGPLMRAPVIGFAIRDPATRATLVDASTRATHTHLLAVEAARAIAELAAAARDGAHDTTTLLAVASAQLRSNEWRAPLERLESALERGVSAEAWAAGEGLERGVTGYVLHTLPAVLFAWLREPGDYVGTVATAIALGGDTDTVAAIAGALAGAVAGEGAIPAALVRGVVDWPLTPARVIALADSVAALSIGREVAPPRSRLAPLRLVRNLVVGAVAVLHVLRRWVARATP